MKGGIEDKDIGLNDIKKQLKELSKLNVQAGVVEGSGEEDGVSIAQYATWNELGVPGKKKKWFIPPRPFVRAWADSRKEEIKQKLDALYAQVVDGKMTADQAIQFLGQFAQDGIKGYMKTGKFVPNSDVTINGSEPDKNGKKFIKGKGSSKPLFDKGTLFNSIRFKVVKGK